MKIGDYRVRSAIQRVEHLEQDLPGLVEASVHKDLADVLVVANGLLEDCFELDIQLQEAELDGHDLLRELFERWLASTQTIERALNRAESLRGDFDGLPKEGVLEFRNGIREVRALLNPSFELSSAMTDLADEAIDDYRSGKCLPVPKL